MAIKLLRLTGADDAFTGTDEAEEIHGLGGSDRVLGRGGDDRLFSDDELSFSSWLDRTLKDRASYLDGGDGDDELESFAIADSFATGGSGDDVVVSRSYGAAVGRGGIGDDVLGVSGERGDARAEGGAGHDLVSVKALHGHATALGGAGDDELSVDRSESGELLGGSGDDLLVVTGAKDGQVTQMVGGAGKDVMQGENNGNEAYRFREGHTGSGDRADEVRYFGEEDVIDLSGIDANGAGPGEGSFAWVGRNRDPGTGEISFHEVANSGFVATVVTYDHGGGDREILLTNPRVDGLSADDFVL
jgi:hypothetical protein